MVVAGTAGAIAVQKGAGYNIQSFNVPPAVSLKCRATTSSPNPICHDY